MQRTGRKNDPAFRIVVAEHTVGPKSGDFVEKLGAYHPKTKDVSLNSERIKYWLSVGAKASDRLHNLFITQGIIKGEKINVLPKKTPIIKEKTEEEKAAEAPVAEETVAAEEAPTTEEAAPEAPEEEKAAA